MISIIILAYKRLEHTKKCIESIITRTYETPYELVLIYNNGNPKIVDYFYKIEDYFSYLSKALDNHPFRKLITIYNDENLGLQPGRNQGMEVATGEYMMWLDNDAWIEDDLNRIPTRPNDWLRRTDCLGRFVRWMDGLKRDNKTPVIVGQTGAYWGPNKITERHRCIKDMSEVDAVMGYNVAFHREVYEKAGPIDDFYGIRGRQDTEFCFNAKYHGFKVFRSGYFGIGHDWGSKVTTDELREKFKTNTQYLKKKWNAKNKKGKLNLVSKNKWVTG